MSTLIFDSETTALVNPKQPPSHPSQPHLVQLGAILLDDGGVERGAIDLIIRPEGWEVPEAAAAVHGITTAIAERHGVPLLVALAAFNHLAKIATAHVGHNIDFDLRVLQAAFHRASRPFPAMNPRCTKDMADGIMRPPPTDRMVAAGFGHKSKPPTLTECIQFFFGETLQNAHSAVVDARACGRVYMEIVRRSSMGKEAA